MNYLVRSIIGCLISGCIIIFAVWGILILTKKDNKLLKKIIEENTPFNPQKFEFLFNHPTVKISKYGRGFQYCSFKKSREEIIIEDDRPLTRVGTLKVARSLPATWTEVYHDNHNNGACYFLFANNVKSSLICFKYDTIINYIWELSQICKVYSQPIDWDGKNY